MLFIPILPPILPYFGYYRGGYSPPKDVVLSLDLDQIKEITFIPCKENDDRFMHFTFYPKDQGIRSFEFVHGELVSKVGLETKIEFKSIEDWYKVRQILFDLVPNAIQENEKL